MSYILEALKKAEQQRDIGRVPGIDTEHEKADRRGPGGRWMLVLVVVLVVNAGLLLVALWPEQDPSPVSSRSPDLAPRLAAPEPRAVQPPVTAPEPPRRPPNREAPRNPGSMPAGEAVASAAPTESAGLTSAALPLRPLEPPPQAVAAGAPQRAPVAALPAPVASVPTAPAQAPNRDPGHNLPLWPQVSGQLFQQINSSLHLDVHVFDVQAEKPFRVD